MSLKKIEQVKAGKWFKIWDLLVYGLLVSCIVALIMVFAFTGKGGKLDGVSVSYKGERVATYSFTDDNLEIVKPEYIELKEDVDGAEVIRLTFYTEGKKGYNEIEINKTKKSVKVTASNCSFRKDCIHTQAISDGNGMTIFCQPHSLMIAPLTVYDDGTIKT